MSQAFRSVLFSIFTVLPLTLFTGSQTYAQRLTDDFSLTGLDSCRWFDFEHVKPMLSTQGNGVLTLSTRGNEPTSINRVHSQFSMRGDFDTEITITPGVGWGGIFQSSDGSAHQGVGLNIGIDEQTYAAIHLQHFKPNDFSLVAFNNSSRGFQQLARINLNSSAVKVRMVRSGNQFSYFYATTGDWILLAQNAIPWQEVSLNFSASSILAGTVFSATLDNFRVDGPLDSVVRATLNASYRKRPDFMLGGVFETYLIAQTWGNVWGNNNPFTTLANNGMQYARIPVSTFSSPALRGKPRAEWPPVWQEEYWIANENRVEMMRVAQQAGMSVVPVLYLSDQAANSSAQKAPAAWKGLSLADTLIQVRNHGRDIAQTIKDNGINPRIFEVGNEIDFGVLEFRPGERVPLPGNGGLPIDYMKSEIWTPAAQIVQAGIDGIKQVFPDVKIIVHVAGMIEDSPASSFAKQFFSHMKDMGVDYDYAGVSLPYPGATTTPHGDWQLVKFDMPCWLGKLGELATYLERLGKPMIVAEASYPASNIGQGGTPITGYSFTEQGQAAWLRDTLAYLSNHNNVAGFYYFYPEFLPGGTDPTGLELGSYGFFRNAGSERAAVVQMQPNLERAIVAGQYVYLPQVKIGENEYIRVEMQLKNTDPFDIELLTYQPVAPSQHPEAAEFSFATGLLTVPRLGLRLENGAIEYYSVVMNLIESDQRIAFGLQSADVL